MEGRTSVRRIGALVLAVVLGLTAAARGQDEVTLRGTAEVDGTRPVLLADVADLKGSAAESLATVVILSSWPADTAWTTVELSAVRTALNAAPRVNWGRLALNGSSCIVRKAAAPAAGAAPIAAPAGRAAAAGPTVRDQIPTRLAQILSEDAADMRLEFEEGARALLDTPTAGRTVEIEPTGMADRAPLTIRVFEKDRIVASGSTRVAVTVKREVLTAKGVLKRGDLLTLKDVAIETRWVGPMTPLATVEDVGSVIKAGKINPGQLIQDSDVTPAVAVKKGELVSVSCVAGSVVLKLQARATADGRKGEVIKFERDEKDDKAGRRGDKAAKQEFLARVAGPGKAVTVTATVAEAADLAQAARDE